MSRYALVIGNSQFDHKDDFNPIAPSLDDAKDMRDILTEYGEFDVHEPLLNATHDVIKNTIFQFMEDKKRGDLVLVYYSGHGKIDRDRDLYLIAKNTNPNTLPITGVSGTYIQNLVKRSYVRHAVIILDCCFSGAVLSNVKGSDREIEFEKLVGESTIIITSSSHIQKSYFESNERNSVFTKNLLLGLRSSEADTNKDGLIGAYELYDFVKKKVKTTHPEMSPMLYTLSRDTDIFLTKVDIQNQKTDENSKELTNDIKLLMPFPFEWIYIPPGNVKILNVQQNLMEVSLSEFWISKYPITCLQYSIFLNDSTGYSNSIWWNFSSHAIKWRQEHVSSQTEFTKDMDNTPVVNISWFDAIAFSRWLTYKLSEEIVIPSEAQWLRSARGDANNEFPWGSKFVPQNCNYNSSEIVQVDTFISGASPYGVMDLVGNAKEWTSSKVDGFYDEIIVKGGGCQTINTDSLALSHKQWYSPHDHHQTIGFRCAKLPKAK